MRFTYKDLNKALRTARLKKDGSISKGKGKKVNFIDMTDPKNRDAAEYVHKRVEKNVPIMVPPDTVALYELKE